LEDSLATMTIDALFDYLSQHIVVTKDLRIEGCDGSLSLTAAWFEQNHIEASQGLDWIKAHGPDCNCDCEIFSTLQEQLSGEVVGG
jgi:hypothetical protein